MRAGTHVKEIAFFLVAFATLAGVYSLLALIPNHRSQQTIPDVCRIRSWTALMKPGVGIL